MKIWIKQISYYLPENIITNEQMIKDYKIRMKPSWVEKFVGIKERRWASPDQATSDLAVKSCEKLDLSKFNGSVFLSTITGDFLTPSTSSIIKNKLNITNDLPAFDINSACAGLIFALDAAMNRLKSTADHEALVVASECRSKFINMNDRRTAFLFGDGACSLILEKNDQAPGEVEWVKVQTLASKNYEIYIPAGGTKNPINQQHLENHDHLIKMNDGSKISDMTQTTLVETVNKTIAEKGLSLDDFDHFIFHQGNGVLIKAIAKELGVDESKVWINFPRYGNSSSASVGVSLAEAFEQKKLKKGQRVLLMAMGAGYHCGLASILWGLD